MKLTYATTAPESAQADVLIVFASPEERTNGKKSKDARPRVLSADTLPPSRQVRVPSQTFSDHLPVVVEFRQPDSSGSDSLPG